jgi:transposase-like protein
MTKRQSREFLPERDLCLSRIRWARFGTTINCVYCHNNAVIKRGTTNKGAQQYWCDDCDSYFNDLTGTAFSQRRFDIEEMFYIIEKKKQSIPVAQIAREIDRDYRSVLEFIRDVQIKDNDNDEFDMYRI